MLVPQRKQASCDLTWHATGTLSSRTPELAPHAHTHLRSHPPCVCWRNQLSRAVVFNPRSCSSRRWTLSVAAVNQGPQTAAPPRQLDDSQPCGQRAAGAHEDAHARAAGAVTATAAPPCGDRRCPSVTQLHSTHLQGARRWPAAKRPRRRHEGRSSRAAAAAAAPRRRSAAPRVRRVCVGRQRRHVCADCVCQQAADRPQAGLRLHLW
jgi:hypothetical protein